MSRLVITRKVDESFLIGDEVEVTIINISRGQVRVVIEAPESVSVDRKEVRERKALTASSP